MNNNIRKGPYRKLEESREFAYQGLSLRYFCFLDFCWTSSSSEFELSPTSSDMFVRDISVCVADGTDPAVAFSNLVGFRFLINCQVEQQVFEQFFAFVVADFVFQRLNLS